MAQLVKNLPAVQETLVQSLGQEYPLEKEMATHSSILAYAGDAGEAGLIPGSERTAGGGNGNPLQHSMDRGAWWATAHEVSKEVDTT